MAFVKGPNGLVVAVPDESVYGLVGDGTRGYTVVPNPREKPEPAQKAAPKPTEAPKRTTTRRRTPA